MTINARKLAVWLDKRGGKLLLAAMAVYAVVLSAVCLRKYALLGYNGIDLAYFSQAFWNFTHGHWFTVSIHPHLTLGDHAELVMPLLVPFYALWRDPRMLLIMQSSVFAISSWPLFLLAKRRLARATSGNYAWAAPLIAASWLICPFVQSANLFEFHILPFALPLLFWMLYEYDRGRRGAFLIAAALAMLVREDVALVVGAVSLLAWLERRNNFWRWTPLVMATAWFFAAMRLIAAFAPAHGYKYALYYAWLGTTPQQALANAFTHPLRLIAHVISLGNIEMILGLVGVVGFLPVFAPAALVLAIAPLAQFVLGAAGGGELVLRTHYVTLFLPALFLAATDGVPKSLEWVHRRFRRDTIYRDAAFLSFATFFIGAILCFSPLLAGAGKLFLPDDETRSRAASAHELIRNIPPDASVIASETLLPFLSSRAQLYAAHYQFLGITQFGLASYDTPSDTRFLALDEDDLNNYENRFLTTDWTQTHYAGGYLRLREHAGAPKFWKDGFLLYDQSGWPPSELALKPVTAKFADHLNLAGFAWSAASGKNATIVRLDTVWQTDQSVAKDWLMRLTINDAGGKTVFDRLYPLANALVPASELVPGVSTAGEVIQPIVHLSPGTYQATLSTARQTSHLELDALGTTQNIITATQSGGDFHLPEFTIN